MGTWFLGLVSLCIAVFFFQLLFSKPKNKLPPGPFAFPIISSYIWLRKSFTELEPILRSLHAKYGPVVSLPMGNSPAIFVASSSLAHQALVQNAAVFAHRPIPPATNKVIGSNGHNISSAGYGPTWRLFRRNLTAEILHPLRLKSYSRSRKRVLETLISRLQQRSKTGDGVVVAVVDDLHYAMFYLVALMCFGDDLEEKKVREIETVQRGVFEGFGTFIMLNFFPVMGKILFRKRWEEFLKLRKHQEGVFASLIRARRQTKQEMRIKLKQKEGGRSTPYIDTLLDLQLPDENRKLEDGEVVSLCSEFLNAGTHTTYAALQWIMANLVKYPHIQARVFEEISGVMGEGQDEVKEEDLQKLPYLKAVILEGLRRHPPAHFGLPHAVSQDVALGGHAIPQNANIYFMAAEIGWSSNLWEDPMEFKPERFLRKDGIDGVEAFDVTGSKEIKMMPFGAGRRICPGYGLGILHLEYFVANLIWKFKWTAIDGDDVDLSEKPVSALMPVLMKNPLKAHLSPRVIDEAEAD